MSERIGVVGSRKGADLRQVLGFLDVLHRAQPDSVLVSGGADGVDSFAESTWFRLGGRVCSYRPAPYEDGFGVEVWQYGGNSTSTAFVLPVEEQRVQFADYRSAAFYRNWMIAEDCDRLCAFYRPTGSAGTAHAESLARDRGADVHVFVAKPATVA